MTPEVLVEFKAQIEERHLAAMELVNDLSPASADAASTDHKDDAFAEAIFLRAFTAYESDVERLFLHYVTGGSSLHGEAAHSFLSITDEAHARRLIKAANKFLYWAKPQDIKVTAETYIERGWPLVDMLATSTHVLADCERIRNRIAHNSQEAVQQFAIVQRNFLGTERLFPITPGQFLRIRNTRLTKLHLAHFLQTLAGTLGAIIEPAP
jgi:hypothetical protein